MNIRSLLFFLLAGPSLLLFSGCSDSGVLVMPQPVAMSTPSEHPAAKDVRVSSHPPQGNYQIIDLVAVEVRPDESLDHYIDRLRMESASLGGNYVWILGAQDDSQDLFDAPRRQGVSSGYPASKAIASAFEPRHVDSQTAMTAGVLKVMTGTKEPDLNWPTWNLR